VAAVVRECVEMLDFSRVFEDVNGGEKGGIEGFC